MIAHRTRRISSRRGGYALLLVLGMIAMTLTVCYSMLRLQATSVQVAANASREGSARQAALAGMSAALRDLHQADWAGVDSTLNGQLNATDSYVVGFETGDASLTEADEDYRWWPYRLTVTSTGYSTDPNNVNVQSSHQVVAVMQLAPRAFSNEPATWPQLNNYTVYQWANENVPLNIPLQISGPTRFHGSLLPCEAYPPDEKPFHGTIDDVAIYNRALSNSEIETLALYGHLSTSDLLGLVHWLYGPSHWWRLNEASTATTVSPSAGGQGGKLVGTTPGVAGPGFASNNRAVHFNGATDHVDMGNFNLASSGASICAWFKADSFGNPEGRIISKATGIGDDEHYFMLSTVQSSNRYRLRFRLRAGGSTTTLIATSGNLAPGVWVFVVATYDGSNMRLYKDGVLVGSTSKSGTINGNSTVPVFLGDNPPGGSRGQYLRDLKSMADAGTDYRPFTSAIDLPRSNTSATNLSLLEDALGLTLNNLSPSNSVPLSFPATGGTYRLYPGGKSYAMQSIPAGTYRDSSSTPDPKSNPLGVLYHSGRITLEDDVYMEGSVLSTGNGGELYFAGENIHFKPAWLPPLEGSSENYHLPTAVVQDDIRILDGANVRLEGLATAFDDFEFTTGDADTVCDLQGRLLTRELKSQPRTEWQQSESWYRYQLWAFRNQLTAGGSVVSYFPEWLAQQEDLAAEPKLTIRPPTPEIRYHWQNWDEPIFQPHPNDEGLRWDLIRWSVNP